MCVCVWGGGVWLDVIYATNLLGDKIYDLHMSLCVLSYLVPPSLLLSPAIHGGNCNRARLVFSPEYNQKKLFRW